MANVDEEVDSSSSSSSSSSATTTPAVATVTESVGVGAFRHQDSGPRTVCGGAVGNDNNQLRQSHYGKTTGGLALVRMLKEELKERECASLPPMVYDGKSDLCTLGSRPGMECVPLRSPADPYHYHHVTEQTKSLQELQNEVGALLEFRDLVIETFPDLKTKMASASAANSTLTGIPSSSLASSRREWEPGIRTRRKLTAKDSHLSHQQQLALVHPHPHSHQVSALAGTSSTTTSSGVVVTSSSEIHAHHNHHHHHHQQHHSSSLISRSRSNSQSGGSSSGGGGSGSGHRKEPKSGDAQSSGSVVIQDSGFSTETSSSKETHSASSSTGGQGVGGQGTVNVSNTTSSGHPNQRLGVDAEDELWNLLDVIHRKSNRLREEVDALQQLEREKCRTNVLNNNQNVVQNVQTQSASSSSSSNSSNNNHHHIHSSSSSSSGGNLAKTFQNQLLAAATDSVAVNKDDVQILRKERDRLFEQLSDYEAEAMAARIRASKMQDEVDVLAAAKRDLEGQLQAALSQKLELNGRIHDLHQQFVNKSAPSSPDSIKSRHHQHLPLTSTSSGLRKHSSTDSTTTHLSATTSPSSASSNSQQHLLKPAATRFSSGAAGGNSSHFAPIVKSVPTSKAIPTEDVATSPDGGGSAALGKLDGLLSSPARVNKVRMTDSKKIAAILLETNIVELQRHLLTITVQNQVLQQRLEYATRSRIFMSKKLDKSKEDIDDLKFRLEEKNIELEGTKAQLRVLESKQQQHQQQHQQQSGKSSVTSSSGFSPEHHPTTPAVATSTPIASAPLKPSSVVSTSAGGIVTSHLGSPVHQPYHQPALRLQQGVSTPSMKAMIPLAMDELLQNSSSTESAQDQAERYHQQVTPETPKRKPSKIPLPGTKGYVAPKPPTGRNFVASKSAEKSSPSPSGSLSNKSLNKSTGSLYMRSSTGPSSITSRAPRDGSINRPESAQSWSRRDTSLEKSRSSSIPVSSKGAGGSPVVAKPASQTVVSSSPQPKAKRDSLTTRVKNLDSLSRLQTASASTGNLSKSSSKKDLSSTSFTTGQLGRPDRKSTSGGGAGIRRVSSASIGRTPSTETAGGANSSSSVTPPTDADNGKVRNIRSSFWNWLKI